MFIRRRNKKHTSLVVIGVCNRKEWGRMSEGTSHGEASTDYITFTKYIPHIERTI